MRGILLALLVAFTWANTALGQERAFTLHAPPALIDSGIARFLAPRYALKNATRVNFVDSAEGADLVLATEGEGKAVFAGPEGAWRARVSDNTHAMAFLEWLRSDVGRRTIDSFAAADGSNPYSSEVKVEVAVAEIAFDGDAVLGLEVSRSKCGRCHRVEAGGGMGIGSTPSFAVMRAFADWEERFGAFYVLKPHPAFTQIEDVTPPFDATRPSPIVPVRLTLEEVEAIVAYVAGVEPADLGKPIQFQ